jgi:hypothetical protein
MNVVVSNLDAVIFGIPLLGLLVSAFFRVDELASAPRKRVSTRRQMAGTDLNGMPICMDPDGRVTPKAHHA